MLTLTKAPVARSSMTIRAPAHAVFEAFADPAVTTRFWFTKSSGRLTPGAKVRWGWEMYGVGTDVEVLAIEPDRRIPVAWDPGQVEWTFTARPDGGTDVAVVNSGFPGDGDAQMAAALDSTEGFTFVLSGLKALLEHGVSLNLIADKAPDHHVPGWKG